MICKTEGATNRDQLNLCQQHSFLITHVNTEVNILPEREAKCLAVIAVKETRRLAMDPFYIAAEERRKQHVQDVAKEDKLLRAQAVKDAKLQAATAEKARVALLSPSEKRADVAAKKLAASEKKDSVMTILTLKHLLDVRDYRMQQKTTILLDFVYKFHILLILFYKSIYLKLCTYIYVTDILYIVKIVLYIYLHL